MHAQHVHFHQLSWQGQREWRAQDGAHCGGSLPHFQLPKERLLAAQGCQQHSSHECRALQVKLDDHWTEKRFPVQVDSLPLLGLIATDALLLEPRNSVGLKRQDVVGLSYSAHFRV